MSFGSNYVAGAKFLVVKPGARFEGLIPHGKFALMGWSRPLAVGEVVTCKGWSDAVGPGMSMRVLNFDGAKVPEAAIVMQIWPFESLFRPYPLYGLLEPLDVDLTDLETTNQPVKIDDGEVVDLREF